MFDSEATEDRGQERKSECEGECETRGFTGDTLPEYDGEEARLDAFVENHEGEKEKAEQRLGADPVLHRRAEQLEGTEEVSRNINENQQDEAEGESVDDM